LRSLSYVSRVSLSETFFFLDMGMRILLIEDNITTASFLMRGLKENYFIPDIAYDGREGLYMASNNCYEVIILDVMLPYMNGWELLVQIRQTNNTTPILFLTARDSVDDRVKGLNMGADDYLIKPFAFSELVARINSLLRRKQPQHIGKLQIADLNIDAAK